VDEVNPPIPPLRRIVVDDAPAAVRHPVAEGATTNGNGHATVAPAGAPVVGGSAIRRRPASSSADVLERMRAEELTVAYAGKPAVKEVTLPVRKGEVLALIGPSGCGKTTLLRSLNRLTDLTATATRSGRITLDGQDVDELEITNLRRRVGMVFQQPNPFPLSIFDNIAYGVREQGSRRPGNAEVEPLVAEALERAGLLEEVRDNLKHPALRLSGGQQQRLCIARSLAVRPEVLLLDEPCSALDPRSTATIEDLIVKLRSEVAIVIVTHNLQQAYRVADHVAFMYLGELVEYGPADQVFGEPRAKRTRDYVAGAFG
jgi:phosphate transport system ATP-binding protein